MQNSGNLADETIIYIIIDRKEEGMNQLFYVYFQENRNLKDITFSTFYNRPTFTVYLIAWTSLTVFIYSQYTHNGEQLANAPLLLFYHNQYWRLLTAPLAMSSGSLQFVWQLSSLWWLLSIFPEHEKKYSTIHLLVQIFFQNILLQLIYCAFVVLLVLAVGTDKIKDNQFVSMGWDPLIIIWVFLITANIKQKFSRLFFLPFQLRNELLVWVLATWTIFFAKQKAPLVIGTLLGAIQFHILKRPLIKAPLILYKKLQKPFLKCTEYFSSYITIQNTKNNLEHLYQEQFEQVFGKQQYQIQHDKNYEDLLMFEAPEIKISNEVIHEEIDKWIAGQQNLQDGEQAQIDYTKIGSASIFEMSEASLK